MNDINIKNWEEAKNEFIKLVKPGDVSMFFQKKLKPRNVPGFKTQKRPWFY